MVETELTVRHRTLHSDSEGISVSQNRTALNTVYLPEVLVFTAARSKGVHMEPGRWRLDKHFVLKLRLQLLAIPELD